MLKMIAKKVSDLLGLEPDDKTEPPDGEKKMAKYVLYIYGFWELFRALTWSTFLLFWLYGKYDKDDPANEYLYLNLTEGISIPTGLIHSFCTFMAWIAIPIHLVAFVRLIKWSKSFCLVPSIIHHLLMFPLILWVFFSSWYFQESPIVLYQVLQLSFICWEYYETVRVCFVLQFDMYHGPKPAKYFLKFFSIRSYLCFRNSYKLKYRKDNEILNKLFK